MKNIFNYDSLSDFKGAKTPALARKFNLQKVIDIFRTNPPLTRAEVSRLSGFSSPTMTKLFNSLLKSNLIHEVEGVINKPGRPSKTYTLSGEKIQVFGAVIGMKTCRIFTAPLALKLDKYDEYEFPLPDSYDKLIGEFRSFIKKKMNSNVNYPGLALTTSGLINSNEQRIMICPNIRYLDNRQPALDITAGYMLRTVTVHEEHSQSIAEQAAGNTRNLDDFAMLDISEGMGVGVVSGGRYLTGQCGFTGEIGHINAVVNGLSCGCGKNGCFETVATDSALLKLYNYNHRTKYNFEEFAQLCRHKELNFQTELDETFTYIAKALGLIINMFNPGLILIKSKIFDLDDSSKLLKSLRGKVEEFAISPSYNVCEITRTSAVRDSGVHACISNMMIDSIIE